jgi:hypothetical protein
VGRFTGGTLVPGAGLRLGFAVSTPFNPMGDWGQAYQLAHPRGPNAELICFFLAKELDPMFNPPAGRFFYNLSVFNAGTATTSFDVDF